MTQDHRKFKLNLDFKDVFKHRKESIPRTLNTTTCMKVIEFFLQSMERKNPSWVQHICQWLFHTLQSDRLPSTTAWFSMLTMDGVGDELKLLANRIIQAGGTSCPEWS